MNYPLSSYNSEQAAALETVCRGLARFPSQTCASLTAAIDDYLIFRKEVDRFFATHFAGYCRPKCFRTRLSACCSKEGIVTFFGDVVVNALVSEPVELQRLAESLKAPHTGHRCVYLGPTGCRWRVPPIVCAMFICEAARKHAYSIDPSSRAAWKAIQQRRKSFTWPDRPVLFDRLEQVFIDAGCQSELMYLHNSPGMLRVKRQARRAAAQQDHGSG